MLTAVLLQLRIPDETPVSEAVASRLRQARVLVSEALDRVRQTSFDLRPAVLDHLGLAPALVSLFDRFQRVAGVRVDFHHQGIDRRFDGAIETAAYRVVQESLTNAARHSGVASVAAKAWFKNEILSVQVEDRGRGFELEQTLAQGRGSGVMGMIERVRAVGGRLTIRSDAGQGTRVTAELPASLATR